MGAVLTTEQMRKHVAQSRHHIARQEAIIVRLTSQGHDAMAAEADGILASMRFHLEIQLNMLAQRQGPGRGH